MKEGRDAKAFQLAMIAATLAGPSQKAEAMLPQAERLLAAARDRVDGAADGPADAAHSESIAMPSVSGGVAPWFPAAADGPDSESIAMPQKFPAYFHDFLCLVVGGKGEGERFERMRLWVKAPDPDSLRRELVPERRIPVEDILADWREVELDEAQWITHAESFRRFWKDRDHSNKVEAGKTGQRKRKAAAKSG